jgi:hypothetical protein
LVAAVGISLLSRQSFDFASLRARGQALTEGRRANEPAAAIESIDAVDPDPVR